MGFNFKLVPRRRTLIQKDLLLSAPELQMSTYRTSAVTYSVLLLLVPVPGEHISAQLVQPPVKNSLSMLGFTVIGHQTKGRKADSRVVRLKAFVVSGVSRQGLRLESNYPGICIGHATCLLFLTFVSTPDAANNDESSTKSSGRWYVSLEWSIKAVSSP